MGHYIFHERFDTPTGYAWRVGTVCLTEAEAKHVGDWLAQRKAPEAFVPPEPAITQPPNCMDSASEYRFGLQLESAGGDLNPDACTAGVCTPE